MAPLDPSAGPDLVTWLTLAMGFALLAAGVPLPSVALFGLLANATEQTGIPWWVAGTVAGAGTGLGHGASYLFFAHVGQPLLSALRTRVPYLDATLNRLRLLLARERPWLPLLTLRWIGLGYTQVFWLLATAGMRRPSLLALFFLNDWVWALTWTYVATGVIQKVPDAREWVAPGAIALGVLSLAAGIWGIAPARRGGGGKS